MKMIVRNDRLAADLIRERQRLGIDKADEVWDGVYVMSPLASITHQAIVSTLTAALYEVVTEQQQGQVFPGANVSDRNEDWEQNYRCPDLVVVCHGGRAIDRGTHWQGGPDFLVEVMSPGDNTLAKIPFYASIGVQELLVIDRDSREPSLYRLDKTELRPITADPTDTSVASQVVPLRFRRIDNAGRPVLEIARTDGPQKTWTV